MPTQDELSAVFDRLRRILKQHERHCAVKQDSDTEYSLDSKRPDAKGRPQFFGAVSIKKSDVRFHLMPVYCFPELLGGISPELGARMQGKSCFNFKTLDAALFAELETLVKTCAAHCKQQNYL